MTSTGDARNEPWYIAAFRSDYRRLYPHRDLASARSEVEGLIALGLAGRVLDLACGFGRHVTAMREKGLEVVGVDHSLDLLWGADAGIRSRLVCADVRRLPVAGKVFEGVVNLFSSFGYFGEEGDRAVMSEIARVLRPGGIAVIDLMNPDRVRAELVPHSRTRREGYLLEEERRLEDEGRRVVKEVRQVDPHGRVQSWREDVRLYERGEIEALAHEHALEPLRVVGGFDSRPLGPNSPRMILLAQSAPGAV